MTTNLSETPLADNRLVRWQASQRVERILRVVYESGTVWMFEQVEDDRKVLPHDLPIAELEHVLESGSAEFLADDSYRPAPLVEPRKPRGSKALRTRVKFDAAVERYKDRVKKRDKAWSAIEQAITETPLELLDSRTRGPIIAQLAASADVSEPTILEYLRKWWRGGQCLDALNPYWDGRRKKGEARPNKKKNGRPNAAAKAGRPGLEGVNMTPEFAKGLEHGIETYYLGQKMLFPKAFLETLRLEPQFKRVVAGPAATVTVSALDDCREQITLQVDEHRDEHRREITFTRVPGTSIADLECENGITLCTQERPDGIEEVVLTRADHTGVTVSLHDGSTTVTEHMRANEVPTLWQFKHLAYKIRDRDLETWLIKRLGRRKYQLRRRRTSGRAASAAFGPYSIWILDASTGDIYLLSSIRPGRLIGRPIIYLVVDVYSGVIIGYSVMLRGPSYVGAMLALLNAICDKQEHCLRYGIDLKAEGWQWPGGGYLCRELMVDNAEMLSAQARAALTRLAITLRANTPWRPDKKGLGEVRFKLIKAEGNWEPGAVQPPRERGDKYTEQDAVYTLETFRAVLILQILRHNYRRMQRYPRTRFQVREGVAPVPMELFQDGLRTRGQAMWRSEQEVRWALLPRYRATITRDGFEVRDLALLYLYKTESDDDTANNRFLEPAETGADEVQLSIDPRDTRLAWQVQPGEKSATQLVLTPKAEAYAGYDLEEVEDSLAVDAIAAMAALTDERSMLMRTAALLDAIRQKASAAAKIAKEGLSAAEQRRVSQADRDAEAAKDGELQVAAEMLRSLAQSAAPTPAPAQPGASVSRPNDYATLAAIVERLRKGEYVA
jgi:hypothetical protein